MNKLDAELRFSAMIADTDSSFAFGELLHKFYQALYHNSEIARSMVLDRKKIPAILEKIIAPAHTAKMAAKLKTTKFSVRIDEATDVAKHSSICIVVRYLDEEAGEIKDSLWDLVPSYVGDESQAEANASHIAETVLNTFRDAEVPLSNIIAFCSVKKRCCCHLQKIYPRCQDSQVRVSHRKSNIAHDAMKT